MNRDPKIVGRAKVGAEMLAEVINGFVEPISWKTLVRKCPKSHRNISDDDDDLIVGIHVVIACVHDGVCERPSLAVSLSAPS